NRLEHDTDAPARVAERGVEGCSRIDQIEAVERTMVVAPSPDHRPLLVRHRRSSKNSEYWSVSVRKRGIVGEASMNTPGAKLRSGTLDTRSNCGSSKSFT